MENKGQPQPDAGDLLEKQRAPSGYRFIGNVDYDMLDTENIHPRPENVIRKAYNIKEGEKMLVIDGGYMSDGEFSSVHQAVYVKSGKGKR